MDRNLNKQLLTVLLLLLSVIVTLGTHAQGVQLDVRLYGSYVFNKLDYTPDQVLNRGDKNGFGAGLQVEVQPWESANHQLTVGFRFIRTGGSFSSLDSCFYNSGSSGQWITKRPITETRIDRIEFPIGYLARSNAFGRTKVFGQIGAALSSASLNWKGKRWNAGCHDLPREGTLKSVQNIDWTILIGAGAEISLSDEIDLVAGVFVNSCSKMTFNEEYFSDNNDISIRQQFIEFVLGIHF